MKPWMLFVCILIFTQGVYSQSTHDKLMMDRQRGQISESELIAFSALRAFHPEKLPAEYRDDEGLPIKCATGLIKQIRQHWPKLTADHQEILRSYLFRPNLDSSYISPSGRFRIHYSIQGNDAVSTDDLDISGIPDYVEEAGRAVDTSYVVEVDTLGFPPPPADQNHDGPEYDVYLMDLSGVYGYTEGDTRLSMNPETWSSFVVFDNDYTGFPTPSLDALRVTAAHEFHHMIQFGMQNRNTDLYMMEMTSTWMEDVVYDDVNDYYFYLYDYFGNTNIPFDDNNYYSVRMYGQCIWFHFMEARLGHRRFCLRVWEEIVNYPAMQATAMVLQEFGHQFEEELALFYGWNYMTGSRADTIQYYPEGNHYPAIHLDGIYDFQNDMNISGEILPTASRYYRFDVNDTTRYGLIPVHVNWIASSPSHQFELEMAFNSTDPLFTELAGGVYANLIADPIEYWRCVGVAEITGGNTFLLFNANSEVEVIHWGKGKNPNHFTLLQNYPNPSNPVTTLRFSVPCPSEVTLKMFDPLGREIETLIDGNLKAGTYNVRWDGSHLPSGVYLYCLKAGEYQETRKLLLQK